MEHGIAEYAYSEASRAGDGFSEAYVEEYASIGAAMEQGRFSGMFSSSGSGIRLRMRSKGNLYTLSTNSMSKASIKEMVAKAKGLPGRKVELSEEPSVKGKDIVRGRKEPDMSGIKDAILEIDRYLQDKRVKYKSIYINFSLASGTMLNDSGSRIEVRMPIINAYMNFIVAGAKGTRSRSMQLGGVGGLEALHTDSIGKRLEEEIAGLYKVAEKGRSISQGGMRKIKNVVISPEISGIAVHESIGHPNESDRVFGREAAQAGTSYINDGNQGISVGSEAVTVIDEPQIRGANGYYRYDDEGVIGRKKVIIRKGMQNELLTNREYAAMLGLKSNGSARSSAYMMEPIVRMSNTYMQQGDATLDELISEARDGIYIKSFNGWNIDDTRSFSMYQGNEAYLIRNGRIAEPVMNYKLETSTLKFWHAVKLVGKDFNLYLATCGKGEPEQGVPVTNGGASALLEFK